MNKNGKNRDNKRVTNKCVFKEVNIMAKNSNQEQNKAQNSTQNYSSQNNTSSSTRIIIRMNLKIAMKTVLQRIVLIVQREILIRTTAKIANNFS